MGYSSFDTAIQARAAWSAGKNVDTKRPLTQKTYARHRAEGPLFP